jgi:predicted anti-sigma-YlaC factor YlaD
MDCDRSIELLSEYSVGSLGEDDILFVKTHLTACTDCNGVFEELRMIVQTATLLRTENGIAYPDEEVLWQRVSASRIVH